MREVTLEDKYSSQEGVIFLTGMQALVRLPLVQRRRDAAAGLDTAGFISGYRGSPLAGYDIALQRASKHLKQHDIHFQSGLNEDLSATAVWGTQQLHLSGRAKRDGVFGIWYAKGPGVDRSLDALRHANADGTHPLGGVLCIAGDDHSCKSSSMSYQSDQSFAAVSIPVLCPSSVHEFVEYGLLGIAMSRFSGCWAALKVTSETVESSASVDVGRETREFTVPDNFAMPDDGVHIRWPDELIGKDRRLQRFKLPAALAFARANGVDQLIWDSPRPRFGLLASGKSYQDVREALRTLGIDQQKASRFGIRLFKVGMSWPLEPNGARQFCTDLEEVLVVEEKRGLVEEQLRSILFDRVRGHSPCVVGKQDENGQWLLPADQNLSVDLIAQVIAQRLLRFLEYPVLRERLHYLQGREKHILQLNMPVKRSPYFCSGCPHNTSTKVPDGSNALGGIGCHFMAMHMDRSTQTFTQMGAEGASWIGQAPFTKERHVFVNLGDGTYQHSGVLALRAAVVAGINVTYKILFNDAVAMTGAQAIEGGLTVEQIVAQVKAEGVEKIAVISATPSRFLREDLPDDVKVYDRRHLLEVQCEMREILGCTVIVFDQACAAELRRRRNRGLVQKPLVQVLINEQVCEGCGDCSLQSNCISVEPLETGFGRKRVINQSSCNTDLSCIEGFCPAFVTVHGGQRKKKSVTGLRKPLDELPEPRLAEVADPYNILVTGVGGTGILTLGALLGMAAHLDGKNCSVSDITGLAQKGGAVFSHVRMGPKDCPLHSPRIMAGDADLVLACDSVVATGVEAFNTLNPARTAAVINTCLTPVADFVGDNDMSFHENAVLTTIRSNTCSEVTHLVPATDFVRAFTGAASSLNVFMLGFAYQKGLVPLQLCSLREAIRLNGVAVEENLDVLGWGRQVAHDESVAFPTVTESETRISHGNMTLDQVIEHRVRHLTEYQNAAYAGKYQKLVNRVRRKETIRGVEGVRLTRAVAQNYAKLLAYKDEYEIARLYSNGCFQNNLHALFEGDFHFRIHLAPPLIARIDPLTKLPKKQAYGQWILPWLRLLAKFKVLRGTAFDPFRFSEERKLERKLLRDYEWLVIDLLERLTADNYEIAVKLASLPDDIRGFGPVKRSAERSVKSKQYELLSQFPGENGTETKHAVAQ